MAANLTIMASASRRTIRYSIYFVIFLTLARAVWGGTKSIYKAVVPPKIPPPTVKYGILPTISFPKQTENLPQILYSIETPTGNFPTFPSQMNIYLMPKQTALLNSADLATAKATALGYSLNSTNLGNSIFRFTHPTDPSILDINIINNTFSIDYNLSASTNLNSAPAPTPTEAIQNSIQALQRMQLLPEDINKTEPKTEFYSINGQTLVAVLSLSEADVTKINFYRNSITNENETQYTFVNSNPKSANIWFILGGEESKVLSAQYKYYKIDYTNFETYPIKTASQAFSDLQSGKGFIASLGNNKLGSVTIRRIYLAYYDPDLPSQFLQPVIVFEGDNDFVAYVPAVTNEYYTQN